MSGFPSLLNLERTHVRVLSHYVGGAFGAKFGAGKHTLIAAQMAHRLKRPVRFVMDRHEEILATGQRSATKQTVRLGARKDGTLTAMQLTLFNNLGAYGSWGPVLALAARELYACPNIHATTYHAFTNTPPFTVFRAPGVVEGTFAFESMIDRARWRGSIWTRWNFGSRIMQPSPRKMASTILRMVCLMPIRKGRVQLTGPAAKPPERRGSWRVGVAWRATFGTGAGAPPCTHS